MSELYDWIRAKCLKVKNAVRSKVKDYAGVKGKKNTQLVNNIIE